MARCVLLVDRLGIVQAFRLVKVGGNVLVTWLPEMVQ